MILFSCYMKENVICLKIFVDNYFSSVYSETQDRKRVWDMGTIINVIAVVIGGGIGLFVKGGLPSRMRDLLMQALGLCTMFIGISGAISGMMKVEGATLISGGTMLLIFL